jgi:hypothetical protein
MWRCVDLVWTDISEERITSIFIFFTVQGVLQDIADQGYSLCFWRLYCIRVTVTIAHGCVRSFLLCN